MDEAGATVYADQPNFQPLSEAVERLKAADRIIGHNFFRYDLWAVNRFFPGAIDPHRVYDTLVAARLTNPDREDNSLESWGRELDMLKGAYHGDFQSFTDELVQYARQDVVVTRALYKHVTAKLEGWGSAPETEQRFAWCMALQETRGFHLNVSKAQDLDATFRGELVPMRDALRETFTPIWVRDGKDEFVPKRDSKASGYVAGAPITRVKLEHFNPDSRQQVAKRLQSLGWKPKAFGKDGTPTVNEDVLSSMQNPVARSLLPYYAIKKKLEQISDGKSAWLKWVKPDGSVHGSVNTIGCAPGRCSHARPNMAQVNKKDHRMREVWEARSSWKLVGCDGSGIQARGLAHYLQPFDGGSYIDKIVNGDKKLRTDEHSSNLKELPYLNAGYDADPALFSKARDGAKTCLYCVLFGGQDPKLGRTVKEACRDIGLPVPPVADKALGAQARSALFRAISGFEQLYGAIQAAIRERPFLVGLDGRHIPIRSKHSALVFLMQGFEASVMKRAMVLFHYTTAPAHGWVEGADFGYVAQVHDEVQLETRPEVADAVGQCFADCIAEAGVLLGSRCPLEGDFKVGDNWSQTH